MNTKNPNDDDYADDLELDGDLGSLDDLDDPSWGDNDSSGFDESEPPARPVKKKKSSLFAVLMIGAGLLAAAAVLYLQFRQGGAPAQPPQAEMPAAPQEGDLAQPQDSMPVDAAAPVDPASVPAVPAPGADQGASMFDDAAGLQAEMAPPPGSAAPEMPPVDMAAAEQPRPPEMPATPGTDTPLPDLAPVPSPDTAAASVPELAAVPETTADVPPALETPPPVQEQPAPAPVGEAVAPSADSVETPAPVVESAPEAPPADIPAAVEMAQAPEAASPVVAPAVDIDARFNELEQKIMSRIDQAVQASAGASSPGVSAETLARLESTLSALSSRLDTIEETQKDLATQRAAEAAKPAPAPVLSREPAQRARQQAAAPIWDLRAAQHGQAWVSRRGQSDLKQVRVGDTLDGIGTVTDITSKGGRWVLTGTAGSIRQ